MAADDRLGGTMVANAFREDRPRCQRGDARRMRALQVAAAALLSGTLLVLGNAAADTRGAVSYRWSERQDGATGKVGSEKPSGTKDIDE